MNRSCSNIKLATIYPIIYSDNRFDATQYGKWYVEQYMKQCLGINIDAVYEDELIYTKAALYKSTIGNMRMNGEFYVQPLIYR